MKPLEALNRLSDIAIGYAFSQTLFTACKLNLFETLSNGPLTADELSRKIAIHPEPCRAFLMTLNLLGLVEREKERYRNSEMAEFLTAKSKVPLEPLSMWGDPFYHMWEFLPDALRERSPRWQQAVGTTAAETFAAIYEDPQRLRRFTQFMNAYAITIGQHIAERFDFTPYRCVMDVAGGPAGLSIQIGLKHPHLRGIIMDLPPVCKIAEESIRAGGLADRFTAVTADLFSGPYPSGADVMILSWILHDWSDDNCRRILQNCFAALPPGGALLISESVLNNDSSGKAFALFMSLHMLLANEPGAGERSEAEYRSLLAAAGFRDVELIRLDAPRDLIVARK